MEPARYGRDALVAIGLTAGKLLVYAILARFALGQALCQWDCGWYLSIVQRGYDAAPHPVDGWMQANWAFFPLYPLLVYGLDALTGDDPKVAGVMVSTACFLAFAVLGGRYRRVSRQETSLWPWLPLLCAWPFSFYFHAVYTESLYGALAIGALLMLAEGRGVAAGMVTAFLTATRPTGILLAAWIGLDRLWQARSAGSLPAALRRMVPAAIAPLGLMAFMVFLYIRTGDPLAFQHIQTGWQRTGRNPLAVLADALSGLDLAHPRLGPLYLLGWALLGLAAAAWLAVRRRFAEAWLCGMTVGMSLASGSLFSMPRYVAASPVFLLAVADLLALVRHPHLRAAILAGMAVLQVVLLLFWFRGAAFLN